MFMYASIAPYIFQRKMRELLEGLEGVALYMEDVIVHGDDLEQHGVRLERVMNRINRAISS